MKRRKFKPYIEEKHRCMALDAIRKIDGYSEIVLHQFAGSRVEMRLQ